MIPSKDSLLYISGKMSGEPEHGFPLFNEVAKELRLKGYKVVNPAENDTKSSWEEYLRADIKRLMDCDAVIALHNWKSSRGANLEIAIARELGMHIYDRSLKEIEDQGPANRATELVNGERQTDYGHPYDDFSCIASIWTALFSRKFPGKRIEFDPEDVGLFMCAVKLSRHVNSYKYDNLVDLAGYAQTMWMVHEKKQEVIKENDSSQIIKDCLKGIMSVAKSISHVE